MAASKGDSGRGSGKQRAGSKKSATGRPRTSGAAKNTDLRRRLRGFAGERPQGWSHQEWLDLLGQLSEKGHDTSDPDSIGRMLEREKLSLALERVPGLGPRRIEALADRFETLWSLRHASVGEIAALPTIPRNLAERISAEV